MAESHTAIFDPSKVWDYSTRTLTQSKFPFWEELVYSGDQSVLVDSGATSEITIQPPNYEDWLIFLHMVLETNASGSYIIVRRYFTGPVPPTMPDWAHVKANSNYPTDYISLEWIGLIKYNLYPKIIVHNAYGDARYFKYRYMAINLGTKTVETTPLLKPKISTTFKAEEAPESIPALLEPLKNRIVIKRDLPHAWGKGVTVVKLWDNKPVAKLPSGHVVERISYYVPTDRLIAVIKGIKAGEIDPISTGWVDLLRPWKSKLGLRW